MKNFGKFFAIASFGAIVACNNAPEADVEVTDSQEVTETASGQAASYNVQTDGDEIKWVGFKTYADTEHNGTLQVKDGTLKVENGQVVGGTFTIDMTTIDDQDLPEDGDFNQAKLEGHLKSEDFFHVEKYPTATFTITSVKEAGANNESGASHMVSGNLNMRGVEKNVTLPANINVGDETVSVETPEFVIDRTQWQVMYNAANGTNVESLAKEQLIDNNIKLEIDLEAKRM